MRALILLLILTAGCASGSGDVVRRARNLTALTGGYTEDPRNTLTGPLASLEATVLAEGITVETISKADAGDNYGLAVQAARRIWLAEGFSANTRFEVLAHEAAHIYQPVILTKSGSEVFAELVAFEVARFYGHDMTATSSRYLSQYKEGLMHYPALRVDIALATKRLTNRVHIWP